MRGLTWISALGCALLAAGCAQGSSGDPDSGGGDASGDSGPRDAEPRDTGPRDTGPRDTGPRDSGGMDAGGGTDAGGTDAGGTDSGGGTDAGGGADAGGGGPCAADPGTVAIVEVMVASQSGGGDRGEWLEIQSLADCTVMLGGVTIESPDLGGTVRTHTIADGTSLPPGGQLVLAQSGVAAENHSLMHDYVYGAGGGIAEVVLDNSADTLRLKNGDSLLDEISWPTGGFTYGRAQQFPASSDATANGSWSGWCEATVVYSTSGGTFYGTPGEANDDGC